MEGKVIGLIGFGTVGRQVAQRAKGFDMDVLVYDPYQSAENVAAL
jgi:D-3-phosphoglycerate dehydrogenase